MRKGIFIAVLLIFILTLSVNIFTSTAIAQTPDKNKETITPEPKASPSTKPAGNVNQSKLLSVFDRFSQLRVYIEFFFMESGDYPESLDQLNKDLNSILPPSLPKVQLPKDPATGKEFIYTRSKDEKSYTLSVPDPSAYGLDKFELSSVEWGGFNQIAQERKYKFLAMICVENIKALATAVEYYAKDNGKIPAQLKDLMPKYVKTMPVCPINGKFYEYKVDGEDYYIKCPNAREHQMNELMFSSKRGWVTR